MFTRNSNKGGGPSGEPARENDFVVGATERLSGNTGKVMKLVTRFGADELTVAWVKGPKAGTTEVVRQWEVAGTGTMW